MDFQQLLSRLAGEHRRLQQDRNELSEEVSRLRKQLERFGTQEALPGQVSPPGPHGADGDGGVANQAGVVTVRALTMRQLNSEAREADAHSGHFIEMSVEAGPHTTTSTQRGLDVEWRGFTAGLPAHAHQTALELRVFESLGEGEPARSVGSASIEFRSLSPGRWEKRSETLQSQRGLVEFEVRWQPGGASGNALVSAAAERKAPVHVRTPRQSALGELDWHDEKEHTSRDRQRMRFLEMFGLDESAQYSYRVTSEDLKKVLAKRGLRNFNDTFLDKALLELERVSPHRPPQGMSPDVAATTLAFSNLLPIGNPIRKISKKSCDMQCPNAGISFEAFVAAIVIPDLPKLVESRFSLGIEKMQEALLKQDVDEVIAKLSRKRVALTAHMDPDKISPAAKKVWVARIDSALNVVVTLTVFASIFCLGLSTETDPDWEGWILLEAVFAAIFVMESVLRITIHGPRVYWCGQDRYWNWLDIFVTAITAADVCLTLIVESDLSIGRLALAIRTLRVVRLGRLLHFMRSPLIRELSNMLLGFALGCPALLWVSIILWFVVALLAMGLRIAVGPEPGDDVLIGKCGFGDNPLVMVDTDPDCGRHKLYAEEYCGSLTKCMFTVFRCMIGDCSSSGGQSLAAHLSAGYGLRFDFVYLTGMIVTIFGLFNVITAIFVEATMVGLKYNESKQKLRSVYEHHYVNRKLRELVKRITCVAKYVQRCKKKDARTDSSEEIPASLGMLNRALGLTTNFELSDNPDSVDSIELTEDEFFAVLDDDVVRRILQQLDIEVDGASKETLFEIMDSNYSGTVDVASMIDTLMKLRGGPMKIDMIAPSVAIRELKHELRRLGSGLAIRAVADSPGGRASPMADHDLGSIKVEDFDG